MSAATRRPLACALLVLSLAACAGSASEAASEPATPSDSAGVAEVSAPAPPPAISDTEALLLPEAASVTFAPDLAPEVRSRIASFASSEETVPAEEGAHVRVEAGPGAVLYGVSADEVPLLAGVYLGEDGPVLLGARSTAHALIHAQLSGAIASTSGSAAALRQASLQAPVNGHFAQMVAYVEQLLARGEAAITDERAQQMARWIAWEQLSGPTER
jgi:hypothetical protein